MSLVLWSAELAQGVVTVGGAEGHHAADVRRLRVGESVDVVDGLGARASATVTAVVRGSVTLELGLPAHEPRPQPWITVVQGLAKGERSELAVELCSEVGVDEVLPWEASRSVATWSAERAIKGVERWRAVAREAGKQARRARFAEIGDVLTRRALLERVAGAALAVVLDATADTPLGQLTVPADGEVLLVVGPEGGITVEESEALVEAGAVRARLGPSVLRTSGAGAVAAAVLLAQTPRWTTDGI